MANNSLPPPPWLQSFCEEQQILLLPFNKRVSVLVKHAWRSTQLAVLNVMASENDGVASFELSCVHVKQNRLKSFSAVSKHMGLLKQELTQFFVDNDDMMLG